MATWPATLPQSPLLSGFEEQPPDTRLRTQMDAGPPKTRRRWQTGVRKLTVDLLLSKDQVAILETFIFTTLEGGSLPFDWTHPRTGASTSFMLESIPKYSAVTHSLFQTSLSLEILP